MTDFPTAALPYSVSVAFSGDGINTPYGSPGEVEILQEEYMQDILQMTWWGGDATTNSVQSGAPVAVSWGGPTSQRLFYGYVNQVERLTNGLAKASMVQRNGLQITCMGATWPMRQQDNRSWFNHTASQVVTQIAGLFHLDVETDPTDTMVWSSLQMAGRSYWQFCVSLAHKLGYTFYANGVKLVFKQRSTNPQAVGGVAAVYDYRADPNGILQFRPLLGSTSSAGGELANRSAAGINPRTNQVVYAYVAGSPSTSLLGAQADTPVFNRIEHKTVNSQAEVQAKTNASGLTNQMYLSAEAVAVGNPSVMAGSLVLVQNANGSQNGLWYVSSSKHCIDNRTYQMEMTLGRDSLGQGPAISIKRSSGSQPKASLNGGLWVAA